jgi:hypothetical protein
MKENIVLFLTHFDDYLDVCLNLNENPKFDIIRKMNGELKSKRNSITLDEYQRIEADNFYEYLKLVGAVS